MRVATWNVNSIKQRVPRVLPWLDERRPDVVCLQETKLSDDAFSELCDGAFGELGYEVVAHGEATWNGVAILSRVGMEDVVRGLAGAPGFPHPEARAVAARVKAVWVDRHARKGKGPSDHAPVIVDLDEAPDGDIGPVVPPPSRPAARTKTGKLPQT